MPLNVRLYPAARIDGATESGSQDSVLIAVDTMVDVIYLAVENNATGKGMAVQLDLKTARALVESLRDSIRDMVGA